MERDLFAFLLKGSHFYLSQGRDYDAFLDLGSHSYLSVERDRGAHLGDGSLSPLFGRRQAPVPTPVAQPCPTRFRHIGSPIHFEGRVWTPLVAAVHTLPYEDVSSSGKGSGLAPLPPLRKKHPSSDDYGEYTLAGPQGFCFAHGHLHSSTLFLNCIVAAYFVLAETLLGMLYTH